MAGPSEATALAVARRPPMTIPLGLCGLAGGWLTAERFGVTGDAPCWVLLACTPVVAACLGRLIGGWLARRESLLTWRVIGGTLVAGLVNGALVGWVTGLGMGEIEAAVIGMVVGPVLGVLCAVAFLPAIGAVAYSGWRVGRARSGSAVDRVDRRAVWRTTAAVIGVAMALVGQSVESHLVAGVACVGVLVLAVLDALAWGRLHRLHAELERTRPLALDAPAPSEPVPVVDFGLGEQAVERVSRPGAIYRARERAVCLYRGSLPASLYAIYRATIVGAAAWHVAAAVLLLRLFWRA